MAADYILRLDNHQEEIKMYKSSLYQPVQHFVDELQKSGGKPLYQLSPQQARQVLLSVQEGNYEKPAADIEEINVTTTANNTMRVLIVKPSNVHADLPVVFYIHGGGWVMGDETTHDRLIRHLANDIPAAIVFPLYTLSPEAQYPRTTNDLFAVLQYIAEHGEQYHLDTGRIAVAGDSVGGNMATVMAILAKENNHRPDINFQLLLYPVTNADFDNASYQEFAEGPWLTKKAMQWFWQQYAPNPQSRKEIYASPLLASVQQLQGLPDTMIITDENDVLRDEGEAYARKLDKAGVNVGAVRVNGTIHDFLMLNALANTEPTKEAYEAAVTTLQDALSSHLQPQIH